MRRLAKLARDTQVLWSKRDEPESNRRVKYCAKLPGGVAKPKRVKAMPQKARKVLKGGMHSEQGTVRIVRDFESLESLESLVHDWYAQSNRNVKSDTSPWTGYRGVANMFGRGLGSLKRSPTPTAYVLVCEDKDEVQAIAQFNPAANYLVYILTNPKNFRQKSPYASQIIKYLKKLCEGMCIKLTAIHSPIYSSVGFFKKHGFKEDTTPKRRDGLIPMICCVL